MKTEYIKKGMPYPELTVVTVRPDYEALKRLRKEVLENSASVRSTLGGGKHGHIGLMMLSIRRYFSLSVDGDDVDRCMIMVGELILIRIR